MTRAIFRASLPWMVLAVTAVALAAPASADAQRRSRLVRAPSVRTVVLVGGYWYPVHPYGPYYQRIYRPYGPWGPFGYGYPLRRDASAALRIDADPQDAEVFVDGYFAGLVDDFDNPFQRLYLPPGGHEIVIHRDGYRPATHRLYLEPWGSVTIRDRLVPLAPGEAPAPRPAPAPTAPPAERGYDAPPVREPRAVPTARFGSLALVVQPADAEILVDGEPWTVPPGQPRVVIELPEGRHRLEVRKEGYARYAEEVLIRAGRTLSLNISLVRAVR